MLKATFNEYFSHTEVVYLPPRLPQKPHFAIWGEPSTPSKKTTARPGGYGWSWNNPQEYDPGNQQSHSKRANPGPALTPHTALLNRSCAGIGFTKKLRLKM